MKTGVLRSDWRRLVRDAGVAIALIAGAVAVALRDVDATMLTVGLLVSLLLLRFRRGGFGLAGLTIAFALTAFWCVAGAIVNFSHGSTFFADALTSVLGLAAVAGLAGIVLTALKAPSDALRTFRRATISLVVVALVGSFLASRSVKSAAQAGDIKVIAQHVKYSPAIVRTSAGTIGLDLINRDFFWHTFTISKLHKNFNVATRGESRFEFRAAPGRYEFKCLIPGHEQAGMKGVLVVR